MHLKERQFQFHMLAILVKREDISRREDLCTLNFFPERAAEYAYHK